jgi:hypothetical protein
MRFLFFTIKFFPYWAIPLGLIFFEMAYVFRRRANYRLMKRMILFGLICFGMTALFFIFRLDMTAYPWLRDRLIIVE